MWEGNGRSLYRSPEVIYLAENSWKINKQDRLSDRAVETAYIFEKKILCKLLCIHCLVIQISLGAVRHLDYTQT